jgi:hypothetical protein
MSSTKDNAHQYYEELSELAALHAIDPEEYKELSAHLVNCQSCQQRVKDTEALLSRLSDIFDDLPPLLWENIKSQITKKSARKTPFVFKKNKVFGVRAIAATMAAVVMFVIGFLGFKVANLESQISQLSNLAISQQLNLAAQRALTSPTSEKFTLVGNNSKPVAQLVLTKSGQAFLFNLGLNPVKITQTYQLWGVSNSEAISLAVLGPNFKVVGLKIGDPSEFNAVALTVEHSGGVVISTQKPVGIAKI